MIQDIPVPHLVFCMFCCQEAIDTIIQIHNMIIYRVALLYYLLLKCFIIQSLEIFPGNCGLKVRHKLLYTGNHLVNACCNSKRSEEYWHSILPSCVVVSSCAAIGYDPNSWLKSFYVEHRVVVVAAYTPRTRIIVHNVHLL